LALNKLNIELLTVVGASGRSSHVFASQGEGRRADENDDRIWPSGIARVGVPEARATRPLLLSATINTFETMQLPLQLTPISLILDSLFSGVYDDLVIDQVDPRLRTRTHFGENSGGAGRGIGLEFG
jgi:hypothetical protein